MRVRAPLAVAAVLAALAPLSFAAFEPKGMWDGCGQGSWVQMKTTTKTVMPGMEVPDSVSESRQTLVKVTDAEWVVKMETKTGDAWGNGMEITLPRVAPKGTEKDAPKPEDLGADKVTIDGKEYAVKKWKTTVAGNTVISWTSDDQGLLKSESTGADMSSTTEVTSLSKSAKVGDKEVSCRETKTVTKAQGAENTTVMLTSDAVPGGSVRMEMSMAKPTTMTTVTETTGFEVK